MDCSIYVVKAKALISCKVMAQFIWMIASNMRKMLFCHNIGIKHVFPCINIRCVPREVLKTEGAARGFQHRPRNPANVNARKNMFDRYYCIKV